MVMIDDQMGIIFPAGNFHRFFEFPIFASLEVDGKPIAADRC